MNIRDAAILFTMHILRQANDWEEAQHALADHPRFGPWLSGHEDAIVETQSIIRESEERLESEINY